MTVELELAREFQGSCCLPKLSRTQSTSATTAQLAMGDTGLSVDETISALQKVVRVQHSQIEKLNTKYDALEAKYWELGKRLDALPASSSSASCVDGVYKNRGMIMNNLNSSIFDVNKAFLDIENMSHNKSLPEISVHETSKLLFQQLLIEHTDLIYRDIDRATEQMRLDIVSSHKMESAVKIRQIETELIKVIKKVATIDNDINFNENATASSKRTKQICKELTNFVKELNTKVDNLSVEVAKKSIAKRTDLWREPLGELKHSLHEELGKKLGIEDLMLFLKDYKKETISEVLQADNDKREKEAAKMKKLHDDAAAMMASARIIVPKDAPSARLLWTTNRTDADGWVQWDSQSANNSPNTIMWSKNATTVSIRAPGLYRLSLGVFTQLQLTMQVCLNGEPIFLLHTNRDSQGTAGSKTSLFSANTSLNHALLGAAPLRRFAHSSGDVTCEGLDEVVSLPSDSFLSLRCVAKKGVAATQAFLGVAKM